MTKIVRPDLEDQGFYYDALVSPTRSGAENTIAVGIDRMFEKGYPINPEYQNFWPKGWGVFWVHFWKLADKLRGVNDFPDAPKHFGIDHWVIQPDAYTAREAAQLADAIRTVTFFALKTFPGIVTIEFTDGRSHTEVELGDLRFWGRAYLGSYDVQLSWPWVESFETFRRTRRPVFGRRDRIPADELEIPELGFIEVVVACGKGQRLTKSQLPAGWTYLRPGDKKNGRGYHLYFITLPRVSP